MFEVTSKAAGEIKRLLAEDKELINAFLRVRVVPGGCSGFSYEMGFDDATEENDKVFELEGVKVAIDEFSFPYIEGGILDFKDSEASRLGRRAGSIGKFFLFIAGVLHVTNSVLLRVNV